MGKKKILTLALCAVFFSICAAPSFAQITVSGGLALSSVKNIEVSGYNQDIDADIGIGGNLFVDYLLPIGVPLSLGGEIGVDGAKFKVGDTLNESITAIPILLRAAYHFDLLPKLDLYVVGKIGYVIGIWEGDFKDYVENSNDSSVGALGGVGFGFDVGVAYYFNSKIGAFIEAGFDDYVLESKLKFGGASYTLEAPFNRFLTFGVSAKF
ncbi:MAG: porin family protein [Spirochaetaceae bacterium]|nr:porin family protein [Spirochaetaceae bacterium]